MTQHYFFFTLSRAVAVATRASCFAYSQCWCCSCTHTQSVLRSAGQLRLHLGCVQWQFFICLICVCTHTKLPLIYSLKSSCNPVLLPAWFKSYSMWDPSYINFSNYCIFVTAISEDIGARAWSQSGKGSLPDLILCLFISHSAFERQWGSVHLLFVLNVQWRSLGSMSVFGLKLTCNGCWHVFELNREALRTEEIHCDLISALLPALLALCLSWTLMVACPFFTSESKWQPH